MTTIKIKEIIKKLSVEDTTNYEKLTDSIMPTTFCTFYDNIKVTKSNMIELNSKEFIVHTTTKINSSFVKRDVNFGNILNYLGWYPTMIINYVESKLRFNSNVVIIDKDDENFKCLEISDSSFRRAIRLLCDNKILAKTTIKNKYVINHNLLFRGDLTEFAAKYNMLYGNTKPKISDSGKIVADEVIANNDNCESDWDE